MVMFFAISLSFFSIISPYLLKITVDDYITKGDYSGMLFYLGLMFIALLLVVVFQFLFVYYANFLGQRVIKDLRLSLFNKIIKFRMSYFDHSAVGKLVTRVVNDIETIASIFSQGLFMIIADLLQMILVIIIMLIINWKLSLIVFSILPLILYATRLFQKSMKIAFEEVRKEVANLNSFVQERISGMKIVQIFHRENIEYNKFISINEKHKKAWLKTVWFNSIFFPVAEISSSITIGLLVWYGGLNVSAGGDVTLGVIFLFIQMSQQLFKPLRQIADKFNSLQMGMVSTNRIFKMLETNSSITNSGNLTLNKLEGFISFKDIKFSYIPNQQVLKGINLNVSPGETVAIVGPTGAGKSTLVQLLSRFYEYDSGDITLDGISINKIRLNSLRDKICSVPQDVFLFAASIYDNITLFNDSIDKQEVVLAAKKIGVHDYFSRLPGGYDFNVKERGVMLSSGQRQLVAFLRAYIINPSILILDEATSSVDSYSEELIKKAMIKLTKNKTSIIIAHRLETIRNCDRIVFMDCGKIIEQGKHKDLMKIKSGRYKKLYNVQFESEKSKELLKS